MRNEEVRRYNRIESGHAANVSSAYAIPEVRKEDREAEEKAYLELGRRKIREKAKAKQKEVQVFTRVQMFILAVTAAVFTLVTAAYLLQASNYYRNRTQMVRMEKQLQTLSRENALLGNLEEMNIDYDDVYAFAIAEGMIQPGKQQIVSYKQNTYEYVSKIGVIPNE